MADQSIDAIAPRFEVHATASDHFAWLRTRLAVERTLMAVVRTGISLVGFGFAIVQYFERFNQTPGVAPARYENAPWLLGLALIFCGIATLVAALWQYHTVLRYLWARDFAIIAGMTKERKHSPTVAVTIALIFVGVFAFFSVLLRIT